MYTTTRCRSATLILQELRNPDPRIRDGMARRLGHPVHILDVAIQLTAIECAVQADAARPVSLLGEATVNLLEQAVFRLRDVTDTHTSRVGRAALMESVRAAFAVIHDWHETHVVSQARACAATLPLPGIDARELEVLP